MNHRQGWFKTHEGYVYASLSEEKSRLEELYALEALDFSDGESFGRITETVAKIFKVPACYINLITEETQWIKACNGKEANLSVPRERSLCQYVIALKQPLTSKDIYDLSGDIHHPETPPFYAGAPLITINNHAIGTLCITDDAPRDFTKEDQALLEKFAQWAISEIQLKSKLMINNRKEQFLKSFFSITSDESTTIDMKIEALISLGCDYFGYLNGGIAMIEPDKVKITPYFGINKRRPNSQFSINNEIYTELSNQEEPLHYHRTDDKDTPLYQLLRRRFTFDEMYGYHLVNKGSDSQNQTIPFIYLHTASQSTRLHPADKDLMAILTQWIGQVFQNREANSAMIDSELKYRMTIDAANNAIILADENMIIQTWNPAAEEIFLFKKDEAIGQPVTIIIPNKYLQKHNEGVKRYKKTKKGKVIGKTVEVEGKRKDGHLLPLELSLYTWESEKGLFFGCMISDITERKRDEQLINELAYNDSLTGLNNRTAFIEKMDAYIEKEQRFGLLFIDIDGFKAVNDTFGHTKGDLLLQVIAERLHQDICPPDTYPYRYGGDEFLIVVDDFDFQELNQLKNTIIDSLSLPYYLTGDIIEVSASVGISRYPEDGDNLNKILKTADSYMYEMKQSGGGRSRLFG